MQIPLSNPFNLNLLVTNLNEASRLYQDITQIVVDKSAACSWPYKADWFQHLIGEVINKLYLKPETLVNYQLELTKEYICIIDNILSRFGGVTKEPIYKVDPNDKRFKPLLWQNNLYFDFLRQCYLMYTKWLRGLIDILEIEDPKLRKKIHFYFQQFLDAISPSNFVMTNPTVLQEIFYTNGENIVKGLRQLLLDLKNGKGLVNITTTKRSAFKLGENIACTPGDVIYQNELMQLIYYKPTTPRQYHVPLLIIPPWINKYYILDLRSNNSLIKWLVEQNFAVFLISWINPTKELAAKNFENYMLEGPLEALIAIEKITGKKQCTAVGYCIGGTLLAATLGYMARTKDHRIKAASFFTTLIDFSESGDLGILLDAEQYRYLEKLTNAEGYLEGSYMGGAFSLLRANDMIWSFVINNYLLGKEPLEFDLLYWNSDSTRLPSAMHNFYLRNMYIENNLCRPGGISLNNVPIDLHLIKLPCYMISTKGDHIAPWRSAYAATKIFGTKMRFVLGTSGHIAGIVNPPSGKKYSYFVNEDISQDADTWFANAKEIHGSWWQDWADWNKQFSGKLEASMINLPSIEPAPGSYVKIV